MISRTTPNRRPTTPNHAVGERYCCVVIPILTFQRTFSILLRPPAVHQPRRQPQDPREGRAEMSSLQRFPGGGSRRVPGQTASPAIHVRGVPTKWAASECFQGVPRSPARRRAPRSTSVFGSGLISSSPNGGADHQAWLDLEIGF